MTVEQLSAYELIQKEAMPELNATGYLLRHKKTKAKVALKENDDKREQGIGVFTVDGKMIDIAFYDGAKRTIELAKASGVYREVL